MRAAFGLLCILMLALAARAADVSGNWRVTISTAEGTITGKASFQQAGEAVTGWVGPSEDDPIPIHGTIHGDKLTIQTSPQPGRTVAFNRCEVTVSGGRMSGTIDTKGKIEFVRSKQ
jgi:hypothetical protein